MKRFFTITFLTVTAIAFLAGPVLAEMGKVSAKSGDVNISVFGSLKTYPHFISNPDFNDNDTPLDFMIDESGRLDHDTMTVRNEFRIGFAGGGENWKFLSILESDFALDKNNGDRGARAGEIRDSGMTGNDFGVEKLDFTYDFSSHGAPFTLQTGWNTKFLDIETGGIIYADDHPYIGLKGKMNDVSWEALTLYIFDDAGTTGISNADDLDWHVYSLRAAMPIGSLKFVPIYAFSDNEAVDAEVHYLGFQTFGQLGVLVPKLELTYAVGEKKDFLGAGDADISAYAGFAAIETKMSDSFNPYIGGYYYSGDDDANDEDIEAYNPITSIARYTGTFGMENALIYRLVPALGTHLYSNDFTMLGENSGFGGISNSGKAESPGMMTLGFGTKGKFNKWSYKTQFQYFMMAEQGALEDIYEKSIDEELGWEFDLLLTYHFNKHFSLGNCLAVFDPGDGIEDIRGSDFDETAIMNTIEMKWDF